MFFQYRECRARLSLAIVVAGLCGAVLSMQPIAAAGPSSQPNAETNPESGPVVLHKAVEIDGLSIFYREAGPKNAPTVRECPWFS